MWTAKNRGRYDRNRLPIRANLTDDEWLSSRSGGRKKAGACIHPRGKNGIFDALGLLLHAIIHPADVQDSFRTGGSCLCRGSSACIRSWPSFLLIAAIREHSFARGSRPFWATSQLKLSDVPITPKVLWRFHVAGLSIRRVYRGCSLNTVGDGNLCLRKIDGSHAAVALSIATYP